MTSTATDTGPCGPRHILVIRHGEKPIPAGPNGPAVAGVDEVGAPNPHSLTPRGWSRAGVLTVLFAPFDGVLRACIARPTLLVAPDYGSAKQSAQHRPVQTLLPLAARLALPVTTPVPKGREHDLVAHHLLRANHHCALVCWDHERIPAIVEALLAAADVTPVPMFADDGWPDDRFDTVLCFTRHPQTGLRYAFSEVPQLLLDGDSPVPLAHRV